MKHNIFFMMLAVAGIATMPAMSQEPGDTISMTPLQPAMEQTAADNGNFNEEDMYDNDRDTEIDSLRRMVNELQSSVQTVKDKQDETDQEALYKRIWNDRAKYFNIYYVKQSLTQEAINGTWKNDFGVALAMGKTFYLHKKPILGMIKFGIDWSYFDLNFSKYSDNWGFFNGDYEYSTNGSYGGGNYWYPNDYGSEPESVYQAEIGTAIGVSVTVNPYDHIKVSGHFRVIPSYSMLYAAEDFSSSYGTFFSAGGAIAWKAISVGIEGRWGKAKYNSVFNVDDMEEMEDAGDILEGNYDGSSKWKTGSVRFYISFRY